MLTKEQSQRAENFKRACETSHYERTMSRVNDDHLFEDGSKRTYLAFDRNGETLSIGTYKTLDKEVAQGFKARVAVDLNFNKEDLNSWRQNKTPFSDIETRRLEYIVRRF